MPSEHRTRRQAGAAGIAVVEHAADQLATGVEAGDGRILRVEDGARIVLLEPAIGKGDAARHRDGAERSLIQPLRPVGFGQRQAARALAIKDRRVKRRLIVHRGVVGVERGAGRRMVHTVEHGDERIEAVGFHVMRVVEMVFTIKQVEHLGVEHLPGEMARLFQHGAAKLRVGVVAKVDALVDEPFAARIQHHPEKVADLAVILALAMRQVEVAEIGHVQVHRRGVAATEQPVFLRARLRRAAGGGEAGGGESGGGGFDFGAGGDASPGQEGVVRQELPTTEKEAIRLALDYIAQIEESSRYYPDGMYLNGVLNYLDGADQAAVQAFQRVIRLLDPRTADRLDPNLREAGFLQLARIHYEYKQFDKSAYYFDQIDRDSENWLTSLYEASWAYYQRGDFEKALGNLLTLHSPFFEQEYFPESKLVKAIIYYEACRYGETREIVDDFLRRFTRVMKEIERVATSEDDPQALYDRISQLQSLEGMSDDDDVTARVVSLALSDPDIKVARNVVEQVRGQRGLYDEMIEDFRQSQLGIELQDELATLAVNRSKEAGEITRKTFERELYALKDLLGQAIRIKIEVTRSERDAIEQRMRGEEVNDAIVPAIAQTVVDDERLYWPYEGEYWRDELGNYELDFSMCRPIAQR